MYAKHGLTLKRDLKDQTWSWMLILSHPIFEEEERRKWEKELGFARDQVLVGIASHFLLQRDQATHKGRFEEIR